MAVAENQKKKPRAGAGGLVPAAADITPPSQPDWRANIPMGGASAPTISPEAMDARQKIERHQALVRARGDVMRIGGYRPDQFEGGNEARVAMIREAQDRRDALEGASAPIPREQSVGEIQAARESIRRQGIANAMAMQQRALDGAGAATTPEQRAELEDQYRSATAAAAQFQTSPQFAPIGADEARAIQQRQAANAIRAQAKREAYGSIADENMIREKIATGRARNVASQRIDLEEAQLGAEVAKAQTAQAEAEAARKIIASGRPTPSTAALAAQGRQATLDQFGIDGKFVDGAVSELATITPAMSDISTGRVSGNAFGGAEKAAQASQSFSRKVEQLERAAQLDPETAAQVAGTMLDAMPPPDESGGYSSGVVGGNVFTATTPFYALPVNQRNRRLVASRMTDARRRLERIVQASRVPDGQEPG